MKKDETKIEAGIRITVKGRECDWGVGEVLLKNEAIGKWMVKFEKCHNALQKCNGLFDENRYTWVSEEEMDVLPGQGKADPTKNWTVLLQSVNGTVTSSVQWGEERCERVFHNAWNGMHTTQVAKEWAEWAEKDPEYTEVMMPKVPKPVHPAGELVEGKAVYINRDGEKGASGFTYGKVYEFHNGRCINDRGHMSREYRERGTWFKTYFVLIKE